MRILLLGALASLALSADAAPLTRIGTIPLPNVAGRIDHLAIDAEKGRLFVAALGNDTVEVVDLQPGCVSHTITGLSEPQGLVFVAELNRLYVANGGDGTLRAFDGATFASGPVITLGADADNVRYDPDAKRIYVGYGRGALGIIDATTNTVIGTVPLAGHPESFQLEKNGPRAFVNVPGARTIAVIDREKKRIVAEWPLGLAAANFPLALDEAGHRAFVGCRTPARLLVYDTVSGKEIAKADLHGDCDDVFFDAARHRVYAACGAGFIDVFVADDAGRCTLVEAVRTEPGARTCLLDRDHIYLAVPRAGGRPARVDVFLVTE